MAEIPSSDQHATGATAQISGIKRFLRKARGQIDRPTPVSIVSITNFQKGEDSGVSESKEGSGYDTPIGDVKQAKGEAYAEGGSSRYYEPIPEYEGRHRWDPTAEWTPSEEKRLVRRVRCSLPRDLKGLANNTPAGL